MFSFALRGLSLVDGALNCMQSLVINVLSCYNLIQNSVLSTHFSFFSFLFSSFFVDRGWGGGGGMSYSNYILLCEREK